LFQCVFQDKTFGILQEIVDVTGRRLVLHVDYHKI
jgi:hypothetical protein